MKSRWLPSMPLHVANWMADPEIRALERGLRADLIDALCRSWMLGAAVQVAVELAAVYAEHWEQLAEVRAEHEAKRQARSEAGKRGNAARWGSQCDSQSDRNAIASGSHEGNRSPSPSPSPSLAPTETTKRVAAARLAFADQAQFDAFWAAYPVRKAKKDAERAWKKIRAETVPSIMAGIERAKAGRQWREGVIPNPATYLNGERWTDDVHADVPRTPQTRDEKTKAAIAAVRREYGLDDPGYAGSDFDGGADLVALPRRLG